MTDDKKVVSIVNGKPVTESSKPEIDPFVIAVLESALKEAYAGNVSQVIIVCINDEAVEGRRIIAGETVNPEIGYTQIALLSDEYKEEQVKAREFLLYGDPDYDE
jgi:hypothetical protein